MGFKDELSKDLKNTFFNQEEFADTHEFNGREIVCVIDEDKFQEKLVAGNLVTIAGIIQKGMTVYIDKKYIKVRPYGGDEIEFDKEIYLVASCKEDMGIIELDIYSYVDE